MHKDFRLSIASTIYRMILLSLLVVKASFGSGLTSEKTGALIANIVIFIWLLPFIIVLATKAALANKVQPIFVLNYDRIVNTTFQISLTLFFFIAVSMT